MHLSGLSIRHFRNLVDQELEFPAQGVAIVGENAQGKTNLLEAVYYLETFRSFRGARDRHLIAFQEEFFRVVGFLVGATPAEGVQVAAAFQKRGNRKKVTVDGKEPERLADGLGRLAAVVFSPADVGLVSDSPAVRRRFLDILLSLNVPGYLKALQAFRQILSQRNAALKEAHGPGTVEVWNAGLVEAGARVMKDRSAWVERWSEQFSSYYQTVSGASAAEIRYQPGVALEGAFTEGDVANAYRHALRDHRERDLRMGNTLAGPQRDDLVLTVPRGETGKDLREYGSGGQRRTAALALRLVEAATIRQARGQEPIVLMDDIFAELDPGRSARVLALMEEEETGQVFMTVPKESDIRLRKDTLPRWRIREGRVEA